MSNILLVSISCLLLFGLLYFIKNKLFEKKQTQAKVHVKDDAAQETYNKKKNGSENNLTLDEMLELSWQFLYDITEKVLNQFSEEDRNAVDDLGKTLANSGMQYQHVVELSTNEHRSAKAAKKQTVEKTSGSAM